MADDGDVYCGCLIVIIVLSILRAYPPLGLLVLIIMYIVGVFLTYVHLQIIKTPTIITNIHMIQIHKTRTTIIEIIILHHTITTALITTTQN